LEVHCREPQSKKHPISITVVATDHPVICFPSWPYVCDVIKNSLPSPNDRYGEIIKAFETRVRDVSKSDGKFLLALRNSLEAQGDKIIESQHLEDKCPGTLHCEAVLAAMALYPDPAIQDKDEKLRMIAKVVFSSDSFSKSDPMLTGIDHGGYQSVEAMLSSLLQAFPLFTADIRARA
jgi:hypothetical protein